MGRNTQVGVFTICVVLICIVVGGGFHIADWLNAKQANSELANRAPLDFSSLPKRADHLASTIERQPVIQREINCDVLIAVDGDTIKCDGENLRPMGPGVPHVLGFDTPEIYGRSKCPEEALIGAKAMVRFAELIATSGLRIEDSGERDKTTQKRRLVWLHLPEGGTVGKVLLDENLAREWPDGPKFWCN